jgi:hypothetical protein
VRVATGVPTSMKKFSSPAVEQMQSIRANLVDTLRNWWGALDGMFIVSPARTADFTPRKVASISPSSTMKVFEIMAVWRRPSGRRDVHVHHAESAPGVVSGDCESVRVAHQSDV